MEIPEEEVSTGARVKCSCGSEIMLKNIKQHEKTAKHKNGGVVSRYKTKVPAEILVGKTCLDENKFTTIPKPSNTPRPKKEKLPVHFSEDEEDGESDEFEDIVLDDLKTLHEKIDHLIQLVDSGFSALLGDTELETIPEGDETVEQKQKAQLVRGLKKLKDLKRDQSKDEVV